MMKVTLQLKSTYLDYDFKNQLKKKKVEIFRGTATDLSYFQWYNYDFFGQLSSVKQYSINDEILASPLANYNYDKQGKMTLTNLAGGLQEMNYSYDFRGWLNAINNPTSLGGDQFGVTLHYDTNPLDGTNTKKNGNITAIISNNKYAEKLSILYKYDPLNRLKSALSYWANQRDNFYDTEITYKDASGNIQQLIRKGLK